MSQDPRNLFPRLVTTGSSDKKRRKPSSGLPRFKGPAQTAYPPEPERVARTAVMPALSRNLWLAGMAWIWHFVRGYFVDPRPGGPNGAVVLSFPHAGVGKKASGSVRWNKDCGAAPQEGGRA